MGTCIVQERAGSQPQHACIFASPDMRKCCSGSLRSFVALQVALFDRMHNIRVKNIQEEYQKYMERVRSKAQAAIDTANANYQQTRQVLTQRVDLMVSSLQHFYQQVCQT
jgi:hypothetical protein